MNKNKIIALGFIVGLQALTAGAALADITIEEGSVLATDSEGKVQVLNAGDTVPDLGPNGSIDVMVGKVTVTNGTNESVSVGCLGAATASAGGGSGMTINCGEQGGLLKVTKGQVKVVTQEGEQILNLGAEFVIKPNNAAALPTAAGEELGTAAGGGTDDFPAGDSRSQEASPAA